MERNITGINSNGRYKFGILSLRDKWGRSMPIVYVSIRNVADGEMTWSVLALKECWIQVVLYRSETACYELMSVQY
jgi:hypothetical protein